jgi:c(7)-type cytochrome triheme protein
MKKVHEILVLVTALVIAFNIGMVMAQEQLAKKDRTEKVEPAPKPNVVKARKNFKFNRLLKRRTHLGLPPAEDGVHDPENEGTFKLQPPSEGYADMPKVSGGNRVDWVKSINEEAINPLWNKDGLEEDIDTLDLDILMVVRGSLPDVMYSHNKHAQWLACENCHDEIFLPEVGGNQISMAGILLGKQCGICHGTVAFPVTQCKKCHSVKKGQHKAKVE